MLGACDPAHGGRKNTKAAIVPHNCVKKTKFGSFVDSFYGIFSLNAQVSALNQTFLHTCWTCRRATARAHGVVSRRYERDPQNLL